MFQENSTKDSDFKFDSSWNSARYGFDIMVAAGNKAKVLSLIKYTAQLFIMAFQANIYLSKINNRKTRKGCEICLQLTVKTPKRLH